MRSNTSSDSAPSHIPRSLPGPPLPPHGYRHHPHGPPSHPHQHMIYMPMPPPPTGSRRDGGVGAPTIPGSISRSQQHMNRPPPPHGGPGHPSHPHSGHPQQPPPHSAPPHPYYANHRGSHPPPHHAFMMQLPMQHRHQHPSHHVGPGGPHGRPPHAMQPPPNNGNGVSMNSSVNGKQMKGRGGKNNQVSASMGKTRQPYTKKASGVKWTSDEVRKSGTKRTDLNFSYIFSNV